MEDWLKNFYVPRDSRDVITHYNNSSGQYLSIPPNARGDFWKYYCYHLVSENPAYVPRLSEITRTYDKIPLMYNVYFEYHLLPGELQPGDPDLMVESIDATCGYFMSYIQSMMRNFFANVSLQDTGIYIRSNNNYAMSIVQDGSHIKMSFHGKLIFPYAKVSHLEADRFYNNFKLSLARELGELDVNNNDSGFVPVNQGITFLTPAHTGDQLPMLGAGPEYGKWRAPLHVTRYEQSNYTGVERNNNLFNLIEHDDCRDGYLSQETLAQGAFDFWLPLIASVGYCNLGSNHIPLTVNEDFKDKDSPNSNFNYEDVHNNPGKVSKLAQARSFLNCISPKRVVDFYSWQDIGKALHSINDGQEGLELWKWFTRQDPRRNDPFREPRDEDDCETEWYSFTEDNVITMKTLEHYASKDDRKKYQEIKKPEIKDLIDKALMNPESKQLAEAFHACFPNQFVCANFHSNEWYYYNERAHRWTDVDGISTLTRYIIGAGMQEHNKSFMGIIDEVGAEYSKLATTNGISAEKKSYYRGMAQKAIYVNENVLSKVAKQEALCKQLKSYYHNAEFSKLLDSEKYYFCVKNGVLDLRGGKPALREGKPEDYICRQGGTAYREYIPLKEGEIYDETMAHRHKDVKFVEDYLRKVYPDPDLRHFMKRLLAKCLVSYNGERALPIMTGGTSNSKSLIMSLIERVFGSYAGMLPASYYTQKDSDAGSPEPHMILNNGCKIVVTHEPDAHTDLKNSRTKRLTGGGDRYLTRDLYSAAKKMLTLHITYTPFILCNKLPRFDEPEQEAIWQRVMAIPHVNTWYKADDKRIPATPEEQEAQGIYVADPNFDNNIPRMAPALLWILVQTYEQIHNKPGALAPPPIVKRSTEDYRISTDFYYQFMDEKVERAVDPNGNIDQTSVLPANVVYNSFLPWYKKNISNTRPPKLPEVKEHLGRVFKLEHGHHGWAGFRMKEENPFGGLGAFGQAIATF